MSLPAIGHFADLSHWDDESVDLHAYAAAGASLIVLKASEGNYADPTFLDILGRVRTVPNLTLGSYVYEDVAPEGAQVSRYLATAHLASGDIQPIVDAEALGLTAAETFAALSDLKSRGYSPILYCSRSFYFDVLGAPTEWMLWLADYCVSLPALPSGVSLWAWQHSQSATFPGIASPCDASYLYAANPADYTIA